MFQHIEANGAVETGGEGQMLNTGTIKLCGQPIFFKALFCRYQSGE